GRVEAGGRKHLFRFRPAYADGNQRVAGIGKLNIIHDDEMVQGLEDSFQLGTVAIHQKIFAPVIDIHVGQDAALRVEQEIVIAVIDRQVLDVVGDHAVQPAQAVSAGDDHLGPPAQVKYAPAGRQNAKFFCGTGNSQGR